MTDLVPYINEDGKIVGLEDYDESDMVMPILKIGANQDAGFIVDSLSNERYPGQPGIDFICLGCVKARSLWPGTMGPVPESPLCKSYDFKIGHPDPQNPARFPWHASGFQIPPMAVPAPQLKCEDCALKEWGTNPGTNPETPWCAEQHIYVVLQILDGNQSPALITFQRGNIKAAKAYETSFIRSKTPMFIKMTHLSLSTQRRGNVEYSSATLTPGSPTDPAQYQDFADQFRRIAAILRTPRSGEIDEIPVAAPVAQSNVYQPQAAVPAQPPTTTATPVPNDVAPPVQPQQPVAQPVTVPANAASAPVNDDDLPF